MIKTNLIKCGESFSLLTVNMSKSGRPNRKGVMNYHGTKGIICASNTATRITSHATLDSIVSSAAFTRIRSLDQTFYKLYLFRDPYDV